MDRLKAVEITDIVYKIETLENFYEYLENNLFCEKTENVPSETLERIMKVVEEDIKASEKKLKEI